MISTAMLMAAGLGQRLRPFTHFKTKALLPVMGVPIAQIALDSMIKAGITKIVANVHHRAKETESALLTLEHPGAELCISDESELLLGSAGGIKKAQPLLGNGPFFYSVADMILDIEWAKLAQFHKQLRDQKGIWITLAVSPGINSQDLYREVIFNPRTHLITGLGQMETNRPYFIGAAVLEQETLNSIPPNAPSDFVTSILVPAIKAKRAAVFPTNGQCFDIGEPSLWIATHLKLMEILESAKDTSQWPGDWIKRIERLNIKIKDGIWASQRSLDFCKSDQWIAPCYWDSLTEKAKSPPQLLGPRAILYGEAKPAETYQDGIGFEKTWVRS
jgi:NDP-sugar pyrophosphorylase family protein